MSRRLHCDSTTYVKPGVTCFKDNFYRDFPYTDDPLNLSKVQDRDITRALCDAGFNFNPAFFCSQGQYTQGYLLLAAHYLVINLRASSQGLSGQYAWLISSKAVGNVSEGITIPERILQNPELAMLSQTQYGAKYLSLILPQLCGQVFVVAGGTSP